MRGSGTGARARVVRAPGRGGEGVRRTRGLGLGLPGSRRHLVLVSRASGAPLGGGARTRGEAGRAARAREGGRREQAATEAGGGGGGWVLSPLVRPFSASRARDGVKGRK